MYKLEKISALFVICLLNGCDANNQNHDVAKAAHALPPVKQIQLTAEENSVFNIRLKNMIVNAFSKGSYESYDRENVKAITGAIVSVNATDLQNEYERNEVAADRQFRNKNLIVTALVKSIDRSAGENYYLKLEAKSNMFSNPKAKMAEGQLDFLANLNKGEEVILACRGSGMFMGDAILENCLPLETYARKMVASFARSLNFSEIIKKPTLLQQEVVMAVALASELPKDSECAKPDFYNKACIDVIEKISMDFGDKSSNTGERTFKLALKKLGVKDY